MQTQESVDGRLWTDWLSGWVLVLLLGLSLAHSAEAQSDAVASAEAKALRDFSDHIVWANADPNRAYFIPLSKLDTESRRSLVQDLHLLPDQFKNLEARIEASQKAQEAPPKPRRILRDSEHGPPLEECSRSSHLSTAGGHPAPGALPLVELVTQHDFSGTGTVVDVVQGLWSSSTRPVTVLYVELDEILSCSGGATLERRSLVPGDVVGVLQDKGRFELQEVTFCNATEKEVKTPEPGEIVLVTGSRTYSDPYFTGSGMVHPIEEGEVRPQPYPLVKEREPIPLSSIQEALHAPQAACKGLR